MIEITFEAKISGTRCNMDTSKLTRLPKPYMNRDYLLKQLPPEYRQSKLYKKIEGQKWDGYREDNDGTKIGTLAQVILNEYDWRVTENGEEAIYTACMNCDEDYVLRILCHHHELIPVFEEKFGRNWRNHYIRFNH